MAARQRSEGGQGEVGGGGRKWRRRGLARGGAARGGSGGASGCIAAQSVDDWMRIRDEGEVRWRIKEGRGEIKNEK
jgi:hypothetical protein